MGRLMTCQKLMWIFSYDLRNEGCYLKTWNVFCNVVSRISHSYTFRIFSLCDAMQPWIWQIIHSYVIKSISMLTLQLPYLQATETQSLTCAGFSVIPSSVLVAAETSFCHTVWRTMTGCAINSQQTAFFFIPRCSINNNRNGLTPTNCKVLDTRRMKNIFNNTHLNKVNKIDDLPLDTRKTIIWVYCV